MQPTKLFANDRCEVWNADSLNPDHVAEILGHRTVNALIFDAPFSLKTHNGHKEGKLTADRAAAFAKAHESAPTPESRYSARKSEAGESGRRDIDYDSFTNEDIKNFCAIWLPKTTGWVVSITDDVLAPIWGAEFEAADRYRFAPLPLVETGSRVRMTGDGSACWTCWVVTARPRTREFASWGALPGAYIYPGERKINSKGGTDRIVGGKALRAMIDIVNDYSKEDTIVVDPFCGAATTGKACLRVNRKFIGIEKDTDRAKLSADIIDAESRFSTRYSSNIGQQTLFG